MSILFFHTVQENGFRIGLTESYNELALLDGDVYAFGAVSHRSGPKFLRVAEEELAAHDYECTDGVYEGDTIYALTMIIRRTCMFPAPVQKAVIPRGRKEKSVDIEDCRARVLDVVDKFPRWIGRGVVINSARRFDRATTCKAVASLVRDGTLKMEVQPHPTNGDTIIKLARA